MRLPDLKQPLRDEASTPFPHMVLPSFFEEFRKLPVVYQLAACIGIGLGISRFEYTIQMANKNPPPSAADKSLEAAALKPALIKGWGDYIKKLGGGSAELELIETEKLYYKITSSRMPENLGWYSGGRELAVGSEHVAEMLKILRARGFDTEQITNALALITFPVAIHELEHARTRQKIEKKLGFSIPPCRENETLSVFREGRAAFELWPEIVELNRSAGEALIGEAILERARLWSLNPREILRKTGLSWSSPSVFLSGQEPFSSRDTTIEHFLHSIAESKVEWERLLAQREKLELELRGGSGSREAKQKELAQLNSREYYTDAIACVEAWNVFLKAPQGPARFKAIQLFFQDEFNRIRAEQRELKAENPKTVSEMRSQVSRSDHERFLVKSLSIMEGNLAQGPTNLYEPAFILGAIVDTYDKLPPQVQTNYQKRVSAMARFVVALAEYENQADIKWPDYDLRDYLTATRFLGVDPKPFALRGMSGDYTNHIRTAHQNLVQGEGHKAVEKLYAAAHCALALRQHGVEVSFDADVRATFHDAQFNLGGYSAYLQVDPDPSHPVESSTYSLNEVLRKIEKVVFLKEPLSTEKTEH